MNNLRKIFLFMGLVLAYSGFAEPIFNGIGIQAIPQIYAQQSNGMNDVTQAGENIRTSVIQVIKIIYDKLRYPISLLLMVIAIGYAAVYRRQGIGVVAYISGFTFLWAFAPVIVKFLMGLAGGNGTVDIN